MKVAFCGGLFSVLVAIWGCAGKPDLANLKNLNGDKILVLGNGGMGANSIHRSNTLSSVLEAMENGANGTELDIQMTKDKVLVAYHDEYLEPTTDCEGMINNHTWEEIKACEYGWFNKLLSVDTLIQSIGNQSDMFLSFDCKSIHAHDKNQFSRDFAQALKRTIDRYGIGDRVFVESNDFKLLEYVKEVGVRAKIFVAGNDFEEAMKTCMQHNLHGISMSMENIKKEEVKQIHTAGFHVLLSGASSRSKNVRAINLSPDYIKTDNVPYLHEKLGKYQTSGVGDL